MGVLYIKEGQDMELDLNVQMLDAIHGQWTTEKNNQLFTLSFCKQRCIFPITFLVLSTVSFLYTSIHTTQRHAIRCNLLRLNIIFFICQHGIKSCFFDDFSHAFTRASTHNIWHCNTASKQKCICLRTFKAGCWYSPCMCFLKHEWCWRKAISYLSSFHLWQFMQNMFYQKMRKSKSFSFWDLIWQFLYLSIRYVFL